MNNESDRKKIVDGANAIFDDFVTKPMVLLSAGFLLWALITGNVELIGILGIFLVGFMQWEAFSIIGKIALHFIHKSDKKAENKKTNI